MVNGRVTVADPMIAASERAALLRKYRTLALWRRAKDLEHGPQPPGARPPQEVGRTAGEQAGERPLNDDHRPPGANADRAGMRALAREFPGALRELDVLGLPEILRRIGALADPDRQEPWMAWIARYHELMRAALRIKSAAGWKRDVSAAEAVAAALLARAPAPPHIAIDESFVRACAEPPAGRLGIVVLTKLAAHFQVAADEISRTLFPPRRPPPYDLPP